MKNLGFVDSLDNWYNGNKKNSLLNTPTKQNRLPKATSIDDGQIKISGRKVAYNRGGGGEEKNNNAQ